MEIRFNAKLPYKSGEIVDEYLKTIKRDVVYDGYTVENLEVVNCKCIIRSVETYGGSYELELQIIPESNHYISQWFTLDKNEAIAVQKENIEAYSKILLAELVRITELKIK